MMQTGNVYKTAIHGNRNVHTKSVYEGTSDLHRINSCQWMFQGTNQALSLAVSLPSDQSVFCMVCASNENAKIKRLTGHSFFSLKISIQASTFFIVSLHFKNKKPRNIGQCSHYLHLATCATKIRKAAQACALSLSSCRFHTMITQ